MNFEQFQKTSVKLGNITLETMKAVSDAEAYILKDDNTPVTQLDTEIEKRWIEIIKQHYPDHSILAEEEGLIEQAEANYSWILDPIDGTSNLTLGIPFYGSSAVVMHQRSAVFALTVDHATKTIWQFGDQTVLRDGAVFNAVPTINDALNLLSVVFEHGHSREDRDRYYQTLPVAHQYFRSIRRYGSASMQGLRVALGTIPILYLVGSDAFDTAILQAYAAHAPCQLLNQIGEPWKVGDKDAILVTDTIVEPLKEILPIMKETQ